MIWPTSLNKRVKLNEPLKLHTTFKIGGPAKYLFEPKDIDELKLAVNLAKNNKIKIFILGNGSNLLVLDRGVSAIVIKLSGEHFRKIIFKFNSLRTGAGVLLQELIKRSSLRGLSGFEFLSGIPATVGGALMMNAGTPSFSISDLVEQIKVMDYNGKIKILKKQDLKFAYRQSHLSKFIILEAVFKLRKSSVNKIKNTIRECWKRRSQTQELSWASAGCVFKNPRLDSAGRLIDLCGLKGRQSGQAFISDKHANFIINKGKASSQDILKLMGMIKKEVKKKFNIELEPEIITWKN